MPERFDVVVGGSGMGGLTATALLAARGLRTLLLEKQATVGGYMADFRRGAYRFDAAASFLGAAANGGEIAEFLDEIGLAGRPAFLPVRHSFRVIVPDGEITTRDRPYPDALVAAFPSQRAEIERFARLIQAIGADIDRFMSLKGWKALLIPFLCPRILRYGHATVGQLISRRLHDPSLQALAANFPATAPPSEVSLLFAATVLSKGEKGGLYYPAGGMGSFGRLIAERAAEHGAEVRTGDALAVIEHDGRRVCAVRTASGERIETRAVVANFNPDDVLPMLEGPDTRRTRSARRRTARFRYSASAFLVYLGLNPNVDWSREFFFTTILETSDVESVFRTIGRGEIPEQTIIHVTFPNTAAGGGGNATAPTAKIVTFAPYDLFAQWRTEGGYDLYQRRKKELADRLIERVCGYIPSLRGAVVLSEAASPLTLERWTGNRRGAIYGLEPTVGQFGPWRWPNAAVLRGLYFCGHYSRPSHGIVGACYSGRFAAQCVMCDLQKQ
jgi:prolycopene isomerase